MSAPTLASDRSTAATSLEAAVHHDRLVASTLGLTTVALVVGAPLALPWFLAVAFVLPDAAPALLLGVVGVVLLAICAIGELTWPSQDRSSHDGARRTAPLVRRTVRDVTPRRSTPWLLTVTVLVLLLCVAGATIDALPAGPATWLGLATACVVLLAATLGQLALVLRRPAVPGLDVDTDLALRRRASGRAVRTVQLLLGITAGSALILDARALAAESGRAGTARLALLGLGCAVLTASVGIAAAGPSRLDRGPGCAPGGPGPGPGAQ